MCVLVSVDLRKLYGCFCRVPCYDIWRNFYLIFTRIKEKKLVPHIGISGLELFSICLFCSSEICCEDIVRPVSTYLPRAKA